MGAITKTPSTISIGREFQASAGYVHVQSWVTINPAAAATTAVHAAIAQPASGTTTATTGITNPDVARNVTITGNQSTATGNVVIAGTNIRGVAITETIAASGTSTVVGNKAFATVTSIVIPTQGASGDTIAIGIGVKLGLERLLMADMVLATEVNGTYEATRPTVATSTSAIESNTITTNTAPNGSKPIIAAYITKELTT